MELVWEPNAGPERGRVAERWGLKAGAGDQRRVINEVINAAERVCLGQRLLPFLSVSLGPRFKDMPSAFQTGNWRRLEA